MAANQLPSWFRDSMSSSNILAQMQAEKRDYQEQQLKYLQEQAQVQMPRAGFVGEYPKERKGSLTTPKKEKKIMGDMFTDMKKFIQEHRSVMYTVAVVALFDHFLFEGQFREKLKDLVKKFMTKAENSLDKVTHDQSKQVS